MRFTVFHSFHDAIPAKTLWEGDNENEGLEFFQKTVRIYGANTILWDKTKDKCVAIKFPVTSADIGKA